MNSEMVYFVLPLLGLSFHVSSIFLFRRKKLSQELNPIIVLPTGTN